MVISFLGWSLLAEACTVIVAGKDATVDGSVIASQTADGWYDSNLRVVAAARHGVDEKTSIYVDTLGDDGKIPVKVGEIDEVTNTYKYFHTGYSSFNEHQLSICESTIGQKDELKTFRPEAKAIMTVEQLSILALQRTTKARDAVKLIGNLAEEYGFLGSCSNEGEALAIADTREVWIMEIMSVGFDWTPESGKPGVIWVARRVPDDHVAVIANASRIGVIDPEDNINFMYSSNYMDPAIKSGWYDPDSKVPFNWSEAYSPSWGAWTPSSMWVRSRVFYIYHKLAPSIVEDPYAELKSYPFSFKTRKPVSVKTVVALFRSTLDGTPFSMENSKEWFIAGVNGELKKSDLATPFPDRDIRKLLNIPYARPVAARTSYSFVSQSRSWLPDAIGGVMWFSLGVPHFSCYVPIYAGVDSILSNWNNFDRSIFNSLSARWCINLAGDMVNRRYQKAIKDLRRFRDPMEKSFFNKQSANEKKALNFYNESPEKCSSFLSDMVREDMKKVLDNYWIFCQEAIARYTGSNLW